MLQIDFTQIKMGVRGLATYIADNSETYLRPHKLCNGYIVIDGNNIAVNLYKWLTKSRSAFGGDYDEYFRVIKDFFLLLERCKVTPLVLFDGGYSMRKKNTIFSRAKSKMDLLKTFSKGFSTSKFYPLFMKQTFFDVMEDMEVFCLQCDLEADIEIAAVARALNCPVLSYDSDFFIFDVLYIPFFSIITEAVKFDDSDDYYIRCSIYDVTNFLKEFSGFDKSLLPIMATLLGNDYVEPSMFQKFFGHVILPKDKKKSYTQRKIHGVLHWLKEENFQSAIKLILSHLEKKKAGKVMWAITTSIKDYTDFSVSECVEHELKNRIEDINLKVKNYELILPSEIIQLYCSCRIHKFVVDMINLGIYFTQLQIEDLNQQSSHFPALELIRDIYVLLSHYKKAREKPLKLYLTYNKRYSGIKLKHNSNYYLNHIYLHDLLKEPKEERLRWLCSIIGIDDDNLNIVSTNNWSLFLLAFIYWIKKLNNDISFAHIHALILMAIANQVVQSSVGYFRNNSKFMKRKGNLLEKLKDTPIAVRECSNFEEMLESVTLYEKLLVQSTLIPYRKSLEEEKSAIYCISTIHLYGCFQSCLYHIMQMNALLNYPLPHLKISDFYSGTLLFNFYVVIRTKPPTEKFGCTLFKETPNLAKIYVYLYENLCKFSEKVHVNVKKPKKRKKKKKKILDSPQEDVIYYKDDNDDDDDVDEEYNDENNPYAALQNNAMH